LNAANMQKVFLVVLEKVFLQLLVTPFGTAEKLLEGTKFKMYLIMVDLLFLA
jgi:hypothetical protein